MLSYYLVSTCFRLFVCVFVSFFVIGVFSLHSCAVSVFGLLALVPGH